jgi:DnaK suppressor protein
MPTLKNRKFFERLLTEQLENLLKKNIDQPVSTLVEVPGQAPDFTDQATLESDMDLNIHMKERDSKLIFKIKDALERIKDGTYGFCEMCGEKISDERLRARPVTTVCIACKKKQETQEKLRGV